MQHACRRFGATDAFPASTPVACVKELGELTIVWTDAGERVYAKVSRIGSGGRRLWNWWRRHQHEVGRR